MKIEQIKVTIKEVFEGFKDNHEEGTVGFGGRLNIRPEYQREFVYDDKKRNAVIDSIKKGFPLNVMYWSKCSEGKYEVLDGQQRTMSFCKYLNGDFSIDYQYYHNLTKEEQEVIDSYELMVYVCEGTEREKLDWFKIINTAGEVLNSQELRNAAYTGSWLYDAKKWFSRTGCPAYDIASKYVNGKPIRQEYLERALIWIADKYNISVEDYMAKHQHDSDASELWQYFQEVIAWVIRIFPDYRKEMKGVDWGILYNKYSDNVYNAAKLADKVTVLLMDYDVTNKKGVYEYLLSEDERHLNIRKFPKEIKLEVYESQKGVCPICGKKYDIEYMEADHIKPWHEGGKTVVENCQMLCRDCNRKKSGK